jgi:FkbM family methyltransferase
LANAPVSGDWVRAAVATQVRLAAGRVGHADDLVEVKVGRFDVTGFTVPSLAYLHREIFVDLQYYFQAYRSDPVILDGGSNIGMSVLFFKALYPAARVVAFEPAAPANELLRRNVERNALQDVEIHRAALGTRNGTTSFFEDPNDPSTFRMSTRAERIPGIETSVEEVRLSGFISEHADLVKLDVEGAEDDVLEDLIASGAISRVRQLLVEYHHHLDGERDFVGQFAERLRDEGFRYQISAKSPVRNRDALVPTFQDVLVHAFRP